LAADTAAAEAAVVVEVDRHWGCTCSMSTEMIAVAGTADIAAAVAVAAVAAGTADRRHASVAAE
jgi:hypothetical protein